MRILVVEDSPKVGSYLHNGLIECGYVVDFARKGVDGLHLALKMNYDVIVLDVTASEMDGWQVLKKLRVDTDTPVLFLSDSGRLEDRLSSFELGADDYLVKPFSFSELIMRIKSLLHRGIPRPDEILSIADMQISLMRRRVVRGDRKILLTNKEFSLLHFFVAHRGEVLSRTLIASHVWDTNFYSDTNVIDVAVRRLRQKVDEPYPVRLIHTVRGIGYRCEVERS